MCLHPVTTCYTSSGLSADMRMALCRYGALKALGEKKACFNEYLQQRKNEEKDEARQR